MTVQINYISVLSNRKSEILSDFKIQMGQLTHLRQMNLVIVNKENKMIKETGKKKWEKYSARKLTKLSYLKTTDVLLRSDLLAKSQDVL